MTSYLSFRRPSSPRSRWYLLHGQTFEPDRSFILNVNLIDREGERIPVAADANGFSGLAERDFEQIDLLAQGKLWAFSLQARYTQQDRGESHGALYVLDPDDGIRLKGGFLEVDGDFHTSQHSRVMARAYLDYAEGESRITSYVEDIWRIYDDLILNAGLRLDHYSDFGSSLNSRLGLTWRLHPRYSLRALYGTAFRAPDFRSLFLRSPLVEGNPDLREEQVRTVELGFAADPFNGLSTRVTLYHNKLERLITVPAGATQFDNAGAMTSRGLELETPLTDRLGASLSFYWQDRSPRAAGDPRSDLSGYSLLDLNLVYRLSSDVELGLVAYNLFDRDYALPAPAGTLAEDFRGAGRSVRAELRVVFH